jgi:uncharacterized Zn finger protein
VTLARGFPAFPPRPGRRGRSWWARAFVAAMEDAALHATLLRAGRRFAGSGRIGPITVAPGRIAAVVEDPDGIYDVVVHLAELSTAEWDRFLDQVRAEAGHLAALLDREVPRSLVRSADVALLPTIGDLESECDCPDVGDPCQHAAGLCYQAAWLLDDDPFVLLLLRGRGADELLDVLGREPAAATRSGSAPGGRDVDLPVPATAAYAAPPATLPPCIRTWDGRPIPCSRPRPASHPTRSHSSPRGPRAAPGRSSPARAVLDSRAGRAGARDHQVGAGTAAPGRPRTGPVIKAQPRNRSCCRVFPQLMSIFGDPAGGS